MAASATDPTRPSYMLAIIRALAALGGSAPPREIYAAIEASGGRRFRALGDHVAERLHYENAVRFARQELADGGILHRTPGAWNLVDPATARNLTAKDAIRIIGDNRRERERRRAAHIDRSRERQKLPGAEAQSRAPGPTIGPRPSRYEVTLRRKDGPASTYLFRFGSSDVWKIGYAADVRVRLDHVNQHIPTEIIDGGWLLVRSARWSSQDTAYAMEQLLLRLLVAERTMFERVRCDEALVHSMWERALAATEDDAIAYPREEPADAEATTAL